MPPDGFAGSGVAARFFAALASDDGVALAQRFDFADGHPFLDGDDAVADRPVDDHVDDLVRPFFRADVDDHGPAAILRAAGLEIEAADGIELKGAAPGVIGCGERVNGLDVALGDNRHALDVGAPWRIFQLDRLGETLGVLAVRLDEESGR